MTNPSAIRWAISWLTLLAAAALFPLVVPGLTHHAIGLLIYAALAIAWNLQGGYLGDLSFGHVAFFGLGAYSVATLEHYDLLHFPPANVMLGALAAGLFAALVGIPFLRLRGFYFAIGTLGLSSLLFLTFKNILSAVTLGAAGILVPAPSPYYIEVFYYAILGITAGSFILSHLVIRSRIGLAFTAIRDNRDAARATGVNVTFYRILSFAISAFITGAVGGFYAYHVNYVNPSGVFSATISFTILVMVFLGGAGTQAGPLIGAFLLYILEEVSRSTIERGYYILPALMLLCVFIFMPNGIIGLIRRYRPISAQPDRPTGEEE